MTNKQDVHHKCSRCKTTQKWCTPNAVWGCGKAKSTTRKWRYTLISYMCAHAFSFSLFKAYRVWSSKKFVMKSATQIFLTICKRWLKHSDIIMKYNYTGRDSMALLPRQHINISLFAESDEWTDRLRWQLDIQAWPKNDHLPLCWYFAGLPVSWYLAMNFLIPLYYMWWRIVL